MKNSFIDEEMEDLFEDEKVNNKKNKKNIKEKKVKKEKKKLKKKEKIFCIINIIVIISIALYYAGRTFYYYNKSNKIEPESKLIEILTDINNISVKGDGLYKNDEQYLYKGKNPNNYLAYNGMLWRIISIENGIKIITEDTIGLTNYQLNENYENSEINKYLQKYLNDNYSLSNLEDITIKDIKIDLEEPEIKEYITKISLLNIIEYQTSGEDTYLNNNTNYYTTSYDSNNKISYISKDGLIKKTENEYYGIRPVLNLSKEVTYIKGNGTKSNPYIIENTNGNLLKDYPLGTTVIYNNEEYKIINKNNNIDLILKEPLDNKIEFNNIEKYLNNEYIEKYNKEDLIKTKYSISNYYEEETKNKENYIKLPTINTLYIKAIDNAWLYNTDNRYNLAVTLTKSYGIFTDYKISLNMIQPIITLNENTSVEKIDELTIKIGGSNEH